MRAFQSEFFHMTLATAIFFALALLPRFI